MSNRSVFFQNSKTTNLLNYNYLKIGLLALLFLVFSCQPESVDDSDEEAEVETGSGLGSIVFFVGPGRLAPSGYNMPACGGYTIRLYDSHGTVVGEETMTEVIPSESVFCGIPGAATFADYPAGLYQAEKLCNGERYPGTSLWNVRIKEDECTIQ